MAIRRAYTANCVLHKKNKHIKKGELVQPLNELQLQNRFSLETNYTKFADFALENN